MTLAEALEPWFTAYVEHAVNVGTAGASKELPEILQMRDCELP